MYVSVNTLSICVHWTLNRWLWYQSKESDIITDHTISTETGGSSTIGYISSNVHISLVSISTPYLCLCVYITFSLSTCKHVLRYKTWDISSIIYIILNSLHVTYCVYFVCFSAPGWSMLEAVICIQLIIYQQVTKSPLLVGWKRFNAICQINNSMASIKRSIWNIYKLTVIIDIMFTQSFQTIHTFRKWVYSTKKTK